MSFIIKPIRKLIHVKSIVTVLYYELSKKFYFGGESHDFWEMVYADKGEFIASADGVEHIVPQGHAIFHKPNEFHRLAANGTIPPNVFIITFVCTSRNMRFFENKIIKIPTELRKYISNMLREKNTYPSNTYLNPHFAENAAKKIGAEQMIALYLEQFLILLLRGESNAQTEHILVSNEYWDNQLVNDMIHYLQEHVYQNFSVADLCQHFCYSKTQLSKVFKQATGCTLVEYYSKLKMKEAKFLIRENKLNFSQIAEQLSFESPQYFFRTFKRITGMTPKEYKHSVMQDVL